MKESAWERGNDTVADAKLSKPSNTDLDFEITVDDSNSYEIIANNDYYLGVSNSVFIAYSPDDASTYEAFKVITDCEKAFPDARTITDNMAEADNSFALSSPADGKLPISSKHFSTCHSGQCIDTKLADV